MPRCALCVHDMIAEPAAAVKPVSQELPPAASTNTPRAAAASPSPAPALAASSEPQSARNTAQNSQVVSARASEPAAAPESGRVSEKRSEPASAAPQQDSPEGKQRDPEIVVRRSMKGLSLLKAGSVGTSVPKESAGGRPNSASVAGGVPLALSAACIQTMGGLNTVRSLIKKVQGASHILPTVLPWWLLSLCACPCGCPMHQVLKKPLARYFMRICCLQDVPCLHMVAGVECCDAGPLPELDRVQGRPTGTWRENVLCRCLDQGECAVFLQEGGLHARTPKAWL